MENKVVFIDKDTNRVTIQGQNFTTQKTLAPGYYKVGKKPTFGGGLEPVLEISEPPMLPNSAYEISRRVFDFKEIESFFSDKNIYVHKQMNLKHKMSILLHGIQGTGKTTTCLAFSTKLKEELDARIFYVDNMNEYVFTMGFIEEARKLGQHFFSVIVFDECEVALEDYESTMKSYLDGKKSIDNVLTLFCTNYIDHIPEAIKNRPSRIKYKKEIGCFESPEDIYAVCKEINSGAPEDLRLSDEVLSSMTTKISKTECVTLDIIKNEVVDTIIKFNNS